MNERIRVPEVRLIGEDGANHGVVKTSEALQMADCTNGSTPANWRTGDPVIVPMPQTYCELEERQQYLSQNNNGISWYLSFKEPEQKCLKKS